MKKRAINIFPLLIVLAAVLWGLDGVLRRSLFVLTPIIIVFYEHLIGLIILTPFMPKLLKKESLTKKEWTAIIWVSLLSGLLGTLWFTSALVKTNFISFSVVFLIQKLQPVFAIATATIFLKEKLNKKYLIWAGLALVSAYFVTFKNGVINFQTGDGTIEAALLALAAAFAWGSGTTFSKFALKNHSNTLITGLRFFFTTLFALGAVFVLKADSELLNINFSQISQLGLIAVSTGMVALWIYYKGLKKTQAKVSTILELSFPLTAVAIDIFVFKNVLSISQYIAAGFLIFAIFKISDIKKA